jgi:Phage integrase, N-terminal SAM-like domain
LVNVQDRWAPNGWFLDFYEFRRCLEPVDDIVPGVTVGDVVARAKRNGARDGTPFFLTPTGRADPRVNAFWRAPGARGLSKGTKRRYAFSLKVWLDFLHAIGESWEHASPSVVGAFKEWRLSAVGNPEHVAPGSFRVDLAAIRRFYLWAADQEGIENPVRLRVIGRTLLGDEVIELEAGPSGVRRRSTRMRSVSGPCAWCSRSGRSPGSSRGRSPGGRPVGGQPGDVA